MVSQPTFITGSSVPLHFSFWSEMLSPTLLLIDITFLNFPSLLPSTFLETFPWYPPPTSSLPKLLYYLPPIQLVLSLPDIPFCCYLSFIYTTCFPIKHSITVINTYQDDPWMWHRKYKNKWFFALMEFGVGETGQKIYIRWRGNPT